MEIKIRKLEPEDWEPYKNLRLESLKNEPHAFSSKYEDFLERPESYWQQRLRDAAKGETNWLLFAQDRGILVGIIGAYLEENSDTCNIISVYVTLDYRGKGIGKKLMAGILEELYKKKSIKKASLTVNKNQHTAISLYKSFGFETVQELNSLMADGNYYGEYVMEKFLCF